MTIDQYKDLLKRVEGIQNYLKIEEKRMQMKEEELKTQDPSFWDDPKKAETQMKAIRGLKFWVCLLYTSPSPRDRQKSRMPSSA